MHCLDFMKMICLYKTNGPRKYYSGSDEFLTRSQEIVDKTSLFFFQKDQEFCRHFFMV